MSWPLTNCIKFAELLHIISLCAASRTSIYQILIKLSFISFITSTMHQNGCSVFFQFQKVDHRARNWSYLLGIFFYSRMVSSRRPLPIFLNSKCRNFTAIAEGLESTWVNNYSVFVRVYAQDSSADSLTKDEAKSIPGPHRWLVGFYYILVTIGTVG